MDQAGEQPMPPEPQKVEPKKVNYDEQQKAVEAKWSGVMDSMEAAVPTRGQFFVKFGSRKEHVGGRGLPEKFEDTRSLVLIESLKEGLSRQRFIVITRGGPKEVDCDEAMRWDGGRWDGGLGTYSFQNIIQKMSKGEMLRRLAPGGDGGIVNPRGFLISEDGKREHIDLGYLTRSDFDVDPPSTDRNHIHFTPKPVDDMSLVGKALEASYASAKLHKDSPHSEEAKRLAGNSRQADEVLDMVQGLPPKK